MTQDTKTNRFIGLLGTWRVQLLIVLSLSFTYGLWLAHHDRLRLLTADQQGFRWFKHAQYEQAASAFVDTRWQFTALYRQGEFKRALSASTGLDTPEDHFNRGNALLMLGQYDKAIEAYQISLTKIPGWQVAEQNLALAQARAKFLEKKGGEMTGGKLGADDFTFTDKPSANKDSGSQVTSEGEAVKSQIHALWLRNVQTRPADFLQFKFAYQLASQQGLSDSSAEKESEDE